MSDAAKITEAAVIMAAGKGTRMKSDLPKVCHRAAGRPLAEWVLQACLGAGIETIVAIVGYRAELVREALAGHDVLYATQEQQLGTGHAAMQARQVLGDRPGRLFVLNGDMPLIDSTTLNRMRDAHLAEQADMTLCSVVPREPWEYGRVIKNDAGRVVNVVEERDCTPEQRAIRELNAGYYVFNRPEVWDVFDTLGNDNRAGEHYITDMARAYARRGGKVIAVQAPEAVAVGVNTPQQLEQIEAVLLERAARA